MKPPAILTEAELREYENDMAGYRAERLNEIFFVRAIHHIRHLQVGLNTAVFEKDRAIAERTNAENLSLTLRGELRAARKVLKRICDSKVISEAPFIGYSEAFFDAHVAVSEIDRVLGENEV